MHSASGDASRIFLLWAKQTQGPQLPLINPALQISPHLCSPPLDATMYSDFNQNDLTEDWDWNSDTLK